jgi:TRAP-type mannitol/chloroaromatic compound transport system substrate-binding protein
LIDRRKILAGGGLGLVAGCDCTGGVERAGFAGTLPPRDLKMVTTWPKDFPGLGAMAERIAKFAYEMSGGAMRIRVLSDGELVSAFEAFDAVSSGAADMYHGAEYYWSGKSRAYSFFTAVPFGMTAAEIMAWTEFGGGQQLWDELSRPFGVKPFAAGNSGHQVAGWFKRPIDKLDDLRGMKIRMPGLGGEVLRRLGASPVSIRGGEIFQALQSGAIDGTEWVGPWNDLSFGFYREARYYYWPGFHEPGSQLALGVNLTLWESLNPTEKAILHGAAMQANNISIAEFAHFNGLALEDLLTKHNVELRELPADVVAELARQTKIVLEEFASADPLTQRIYESYRASLKSLSPWGRIGDGAFLAARQSAFEL